jgi:hypothetical protein
VFNQSVFFFFFKLYYRRRAILYEVVGCTATYLIDNEPGFFVHDESSKLKVDFENDFEINGTIWEPLSLKR